MVRSVRTGIVSKIALYRDRCACIGNPLCIKRQSCAKYLFLKGNCASIVAIPTRKGVAAHCGSGKGDLIAIKTVNGGSNFGVGGIISTLESDFHLTANSAHACTVDLVSDRFTLSCTAYEASFGSGAGCIYPRVVNCGNCAIFHSGFKSTLGIGVNLATNGTSVIFLVTCSFAGCLCCFCLCEIVGTSKFIYEHAFVALGVANCTFLVLNTLGCRSGRSIDYPFVVVKCLTGGATTVVTFGIASVRPSVTGCRGSGIVGLTTYATGVKDASILFASGGNNYNSIVTVSKSRNDAILYDNFNGTVYIGVNLIAYRASVIFLVTANRAGWVGCFYLCESVRTTLRNSDVSKDRVTGILFS